MARSPYQQFQYTERWAEGSRTGLTIGVTDILYSRQSQFQHVEVLQTDFLGRLLLLDGLVMINDWDEFVYHEMISHPALFLLDEPKRVLVVGGGDGGTVREVLRHPSVEQVDLVEIDQMVIDVAREYFPAVSSGFDDPRLNIRVTDGLAFVREAPDSDYDLVIVDSTDPVGLAEALFGEAFYRDCARILTPQGILTAQMESPFDPAFQETVRAAHRLLNGMFPIVDSYLAFIPTYATGMWAFTMASKQHRPVQDFDPERARQRLAHLTGALRYYNAEIHPAAFALPNFAREGMTVGR